MSVFSFDNHTKKERKLIAKKNKDILLVTELAKQAVIECITSNSFKKYREELEHSDKALIKIGIDIRKTILNKDERLALYDALFVRADVLGSLLNSVEKDR